MAEHINKLQCASMSLWTGYQRLSLVEFLETAWNYPKDINVMEEHLRHLYILFEDKEVIQIDQCNEIIDLIRTIDTCIQSFSRFLNQKAYLPLVILPLRYQVVAELACTKELAWIALALIGRFRSICRNGSREPAERRYEILCKLELLIQSSENVVRLSQEMFDQARFQEKRDKALADCSMLYVHH